MMIVVMSQAVRMISFHHDSGGGYIAMPTALTGDEQIQQLTMTIKTDEKDGLIFYVADDPVCTGARQYINRKRATLHYVTILSCRK